MSRSALALLLVLSALTLTACGIGADKIADDDVTQLVTRDFGATPIDEDGPAPTESGDTILSLLQSTTTVKTDGDAVGTIGDLAATSPLRWSVFVNGTALTDPPADVDVQGGDHIWWDLRDATAAPKVPAVVGSYPEPFRHGLDGERWPLRVECARNVDKAPCDAVARRLGEVGAIGAKSLVGADGGKTNLRIEVGPWNAIRNDRAALLIEDGPAASGVYARFSSDGTELELLDAAGRTVRTLGPGSGLVAATRFEDEPPTWLVTGTDLAGVEAATRALDEGVLAGHYALAIADDRGISLPVEPEPRR